MVTPQDDPNGLGIHIDLHESFEPPVPAVVYAQDAFDSPQGKTAHRLIHQGDIFDVQAIIDAESAGTTTAEIYPELSTEAIPIHPSYRQAVETVDLGAFVVGKAPLGGKHSEHLIGSARRALSDGVDVVSGMHEHLSGIDELREIAETTGAELYDIRRAPPEEKLRDADGRADDLDAGVVTVMGTDCVTGKGTTTYELYDAAREHGVDATFVATGQTGILSGSEYGLPTDRIPVEYAVGAVEQVVYEAARSHELVLVEAQAALSHPRFVGDDVLKGSQPDYVVLADDPARSEYQYFDRDKKGISAEIEMIETIGDTEVIAIATQSPDSDAPGTDHQLPIGNILKADGRDRIFEAIDTTLDI